MPLSAPPETEAPERQVPSEDSFATGRSARGGRVGRIAAALVSILSLGAVVLWARGQATPQFPDQPDELAMLAAAVGLYAVATLARGWRWHVILRHADVEHKAVDGYALVPVGYMGNTVLPARGGEVLRILLLSSRTTARRREVLGSIVSERVLDAVSLALLFVALTFAGIANSPLGQRPAVIAIAVLAVGGAAVAIYERLRRRGRFERFATAVRPVARGAKPLLGKWGALLLGATLLVWLIEGTIFWLVAQSLELQVSLIEGCFLLVLTAFFSLIPAAPGYVGTFDAAVIFGLHALDVSGGQVVAYALLVRFVLFVPITIVGLGLLVARYGGLRQLRRR
jgi:uncharacterized membrane protein YbhN (UPF0104 family)